MTLTLKLSGKGYRILLSAKTQYRLYGSYYLVLYRQKGDRKKVNW